MDIHAYDHILSGLLKHVRRGPVAENKLLDKVILHQQIGSIYSRFGQPWAIPHFELARDCWERYRSSISIPEFRQHMFADQGKTLYYSLGHAYLQELKRQKGTLGPVLDADNIAKEFRNSGGLNQSAEDWIRHAFTAFESLTARVYLDQILGDVAPATAAEVESRIAQSKVPLAALLWFPTADESDFFLIAKGVCRHTRTLFGGNHLVRLQDQLHGELTHHFFDPACPMIESTLFWKSFQETFHEILPLLSDLEQNTILLVAGSEILTNFPLAGLQSAEGYLIDRYPVVFLSSITQWIRNHRDAAKWRDRVLSIGVGRHDIPAESELSFNPLNAPCKIGVGSQQLTVDHLGWRQVTKKQVIADLPHYPYALFTCHGIFYEQITTAESGLDFAGGGRLTLDEITNLDLPIDLIFMNSCVSSKSRSTRTQEPQGIPMSFCMAGVDKIIGSLWNVWYPAGADFTRAFFQSLTSAASKCIAYHHQQTVLKARSMYPDPYHWAGWALYGNYK